MILNKFNWQTRSGSAGYLIKHNHPIWFIIVRPVSKELDRYGRGWKESRTRQGSKTEGTTEVQRGEDDKVNCVPNHCQTAGIKIGNLPINLN